MSENKALSENTKQDLTALRRHLFATLDDLRNPDKPMDLDRAKEVREVAKALIESAKVEVAFLQVTGDLHGTGFLPAGPANPDPPALPIGLAGQVVQVRQHRMKG